MDFQREHIEFLRRAAMTGVGLGYPVLDVEAVVPKPQDFAAEARAARLADASMVCQETLAGDEGLLSAGRAGEAGGLTRRR
jgi:hypothetical protein